MKCGVSIPDCDRRRIGTEFEGQGDCGSDCTEQQHSDVIIGGIGAAGRYCQQVCFIGEGPRMA